MARKLKLHKNPKSIDPFRTRKTRRETQPAVSDTMTPPHNIAAAIDALREAQDQARFFEGEVTVHKNEVLTFAEEIYGKRLASGNNESFKILGEDSIVTYVIVDSGAGLTEEDADEFRSTFGADAADELIVRDLGSLRFNPRVLEENYEAVVAALQTLPADVLNNLFKPMLLKAKPGAAESARKFAKKPEDLVEIIKALKMKNHIR
jgi:hypothetical protein